jgi:hypothetical protein
MTFCSLIEGLLGGTLRRSSAKCVLDYQVFAGLITRFGVFLHVFESHAEQAIHLAIYPLVFSHRVGHGRWGKFGA